MEIRKKIWNISFIVLLLSFILTIINKLLLKNELIYTINSNIGIVALIAIFYISISVLDDIINNL